MIQHRPGILSIGRLYTAALGWREGELCCMEAEYCRPSINIRNVSGNVFNTLVQKCFFHQKFAQNSSKERRKLSFWGRFSSVGLSLIKVWDPLLDLDKAFQSDWVQFNSRTKNLSYGRKSLLCCKKVGIVKPEWQEQRWQGKHSGVACMPISEKQGSLSLNNFKLDWLVDSENQPLACY